MSKPLYETFSNRFKAKIALQATDCEKVQALSQEHGIPVAKIEGWVQQLHERAELLFLGERASNQTEAIKNYAALLKSTLEASPSGILVTDHNKKIVTFNQTLAEMWDVPEDVVLKGDMQEALKHVLKQLKYPEVFKEKFEMLYATPSLEAKDIFELKDGRFFERHSVPYHIGEGILGRVTNFVDISDYKKTEEKLSRFGNLLHSINTNVNEGILRSTPDQGMVYVNNAFVSMFGYGSKEEVMNTEPGQFYAHEQDRAALIVELESKGGFDNKEVLYKRKDGSTFWGLENSTMMESNGEMYIDAVVTDIHNWKKAEQSLRKSEEKYRTILKNIEEGYFETDLAGDFTFFNGTLVRMMRYPADEMIGMNNRDYMDKKNSAKVYKTFNRVYKTGSAEHGFDWKLICGNGSHIHVEASVTLRKDAEGKALGFSGMVRDVTDRKRKERQIKDSLKEKEVLLGEIHHRVKNNLAVISGLLYLQADKTEDLNARKALMQSQNRINSIALIHELLYDNRTFSSLNPRIYIEQLVAHISSNLRTEKANITTHIEAENFDLEMNTAIPCALIINELITNAYKYAFEGRKEGTLKIIFQKKKTGTYRLEVVDDGIGLPQDFTITDSTKHNLGLSLVKTLTRQLKGELTFKNTNGAKFSITFPEGD